MSSERRRPAMAPRRRWPLMIEFIGTPGAGKTTLSNELIALLREQGILASSILGAARDHSARTALGRAVLWLSPPSLRAPLLWQVFYRLSMLHILGFAREHLELCRQVLRTQLQRQVPVATKRHGLSWFFHLAGRCHFLQTTAVDRETIVVDDGFLHRSVSFYASHSEEPDPEGVSDYVDLLPTPDLVVFVVARREVCEERILRRGVWTHRRHLSSSAISRYLRNAEQVVNTAVRQARARGWNVAEIVNEGGSLEQVRWDLNRAVTPLLGASPADGPWEPERSSGATSIRSPGARTGTRDPAAFDEASGGVPGWRSRGRPPRC
jgi:thymidylate kinase